MKHTIGILAILAAAGVAQASISTTIPLTYFDSVTFTNKASIDAVGDVDNARDTWTPAYTGPINNVRVTGSLTEVNTGTYAREARVRFSGGFGNRDVQASTSGDFIGTLAIGPTALSTSTFNVTSGGAVNVEWFESTQDGTDGLTESTWDTVTYEFGFGGTVITNGNVAFGSLAQGAKTYYSGSHVSGGLDFFTFSIADAVDGGGFLNIDMTAGLTGTSMTDTEIALYDGAGNFIATNDDVDYPDNPFSSLAFTSLAAGNYTLVTGGYNTSFPSTLAGAFTAGTDAGSYELSITYVPTPGALALLGMGGLIANRRRR